MFEFLVDLLPEVLWLEPYEAALVARGWPSPRGLLMGLCTSPDKILAAFNILLFNYFPTFIEAPFLNLEFPVTFL